MYYFFKCSNGLAQSQWLLAAAAAAVAPIMQALCACRVGFALLELVFCAQQVCVLMLLLCTFCCTNNNNNNNGSLQARAKGAGSSDACN